MGQCAAVERGVDASEDSLGCLGRCLAAGDKLEAPRLTLDELAAELQQALRRFRATGAQELAGSSPATSNQWAAACDMVEALLLGLQAHLPAAIAHAEARPGGSDELVAIHITLAAEAAVGEFATRSRQPVELRVSQHLRFALRRRDAGSPEAPLVLRASGLLVHALPEIEALRARLRVELASCGGVNPKTAGYWFLDNMDEVCPLATSKFRRVCDSFPCMSAFPVVLKAKCFWGYLHATSRNFDAFEFHSDGRQGMVNISAQTSLLHPEEEEVNAVATKLCREMLQMHRGIMEKVAPSTVNMGALFEGRNIGQLGAAPQKLTKLFSAAKYWGPGESGWQRADPTWTCVDRKDFLGRVVEEQGRVIWRVAAPSDLETPPASYKLASHRPATAHVQSGSSACRRFALVAVSLFVMLFAIVPSAALVVQETGS